MLSIELYKIILQWGGIKTYINEENKTLDGKYILYFHTCGWFLKVQYDLLSIFMLSDFKKEITQRNLRYSALHRKVSFIASPFWLVEY